MVYILRDYEPDTAFVQAFVKPGMNVVDIGANIGFYSVMMAKLVGPQGNNYTFEAAAETTEKLNRNIDENDLSNVTVFNVALSDHSEQRTLYHAQDRGRNSFGPEENVVATETVQCRRLDDLLDAQTTIDFIKIDVEGAELLVLQGAEDLLRRFPHAPILCEFNASKARSVGFSLDQLAAFFKTRGYVIYQYQLNDGMLISVAAPSHFMATSLPFIKTTRASYPPSYHHRQRVISSTTDGLPVLDDAGQQLLKAAMTEMGLSARAYDKVRRVARTIADLEDSDRIDASHVAEAVQYRLLDRQL